MPFSQEQVDNIASQLGSRPGAMLSFVMASPRLRGLLGLPASSGSTQGSLLGPTRTPSEFALNPKVLSRLHGGSTPGVDRIRELATAKIDQVMTGLQGAGLSSQDAGTALVTELFNAAQGRGKQVSYSQSFTDPITGQQNTVNRNTRDPFQPQNMNRLGQSVPLSVMGQQVTLGRGANKRPLLTGDTYGGRLTPKEKTASTQNLMAAAFVQSPLGQIALLHNDPKIQAAAAMQQAQQQAVSQYSRLQQLAPLYDRFLSDKYSNAKHKFPDPLSLFGYTEAELRTVLNLQPGDPITGGVILGAASQVMDREKTGFQTGIPLPGTWTYNMVSELEKMGAAGQKLAKALNNAKQTSVWGPIGAFEAGNPGALTQLVPPTTTAASTGSNADVQAMAKALGL